MTNKWTRLLKAEEDLIQIGWDLNFEYYHEPSGSFMSLYDISSKNAPEYNTTFNQEGYGNKEVSFEKVMEDIDKVETWFLNGGYKEFFTKIRAEEHTDNGVGGTAWVTQEQYDEASEDEGWRTSAGTFPLPNDLEYMIDSNLMISLYVYKDSIVKFEGRNANKKVASDTKQIGRWLLKVVKNGETTNRGNGDFTNNGKGGGDAYDIVEIYDTKQDKNKFTQYGQFVSSYYVSTFLDIKNGLNMQGDIPEWTMSATEVKEAQEWLKSLYLNGTPRDFLDDTMEEFRRNMKSANKKIKSFDKESLNNIWVVDMFLDNMDSKDGHDQIEFTKIGLIDWLNGEIEEYNSVNDSDMSLLSHNATNQEVEETLYNMEEGKVVEIKPYNERSASKKIKAFDLHSIIKKIRDTLGDIADSSTASDAEWFDQGEYAYLYIPVNQIDFRKNVTTGEINEEALEKVEEMNGQKVEVIKINKTSKGFETGGIITGKPESVDVRLENGDILKDVPTIWLKHEPFGEDEDNRHIVERISDLLDSGFEQEEIINIVCNEFECEPQEVEQFLRKVTYDSKVVSEREAGKDLNFAIRKANKVLKGE